ncbi:hypothetical protein ABZV64_21985 [Streptomyces sp. NPDC004959]|uniref:SGM_3592 family protein n=1 Tax=unclassified Streptomyces TaxID=2593676 RepID=UPI0004C7D816|nr:hypothetical protein [Streptomyces sp. NRRL F-5630]
MTGHDSPPPEQPDRSARPEAEDRGDAETGSGAEGKATDPRTGTGVDGSGAGDGREGTGAREARTGDGEAEAEEGADEGGDWDDVEFDMDFIRAAGTAEPSARARMLAARWREEGGPPSPQPWRADEPPAGWFFSRSRRARRRRKRRGDG